MKNYLIILFLVSSTLGSAQTDASLKFDTLKVRAQLNIETPEGFEEVDIEFLHKIPHNFAIETADSSCQVRYWIRPLDVWFETYNKKSKKEKKNSMHPNALCKSMMILTVLDVSNNKSRDYYESTYPEMTKTAYNADWEASTIVETGYPQVGFKYCYIWTLHKDDVADLCVYILVNKQEDVFKYIAKIAPSIRFK